MLAQNKLFTPTQKHFKTLSKNALSTLLKTDTRLIIKQKNFSKHTNMKAIFKNDQIPKSQWKTTDGKGANNFPFHNLPPYSENIKKFFFRSFHPFLNLDKRKVGGDSCLPQHLWIQMQNHYNSRFCHRIIELETLLGMIKSGVTLEFSSLFISFTCCVLFALSLRACLGC